MCSINETISYVQESIKHLHGALAKLESAPDKDKIVHSLHSDAGSILEEARSLDQNATEEASIPKMADGKVKAKAKTKAAKKVTKKKSKKARARS